MASLLYRRVLIKISGEILKGGLSSGLDYPAVKRLGRDVGEVCSAGLEVFLVVGGGNILRGRDAAGAGLERANADYMGMLATVINALALQSALEKQGVEARVLSAIPMQAVCEPYIRRRALRHAARGRVVIFAAGTGNPYVTTDTAAALRAAEMKCEVLLKGTQVDGVYDRDPHADGNAERYNRLTFQEVLSRRLEVMDASAISLCRENRIPIVVFSLKKAGAMLRVVCGEGWRTVIEEEGRDGE